MRRSTEAPTPQASFGQIAHLVLTMHAGPIGERRSGEHDGTHLLGMERTHHHDLLAGLAVADQARLALGVWVTLYHCFDKAVFRLADILDRLTESRPPGWI